VESTWPKVSTLHRRIELCSGRTSSADAVLQTAGEAAYGQPTGPGPVPAGASLKRKIPGGSGPESPDFFDSRPRKLDNYVSVFLEQESDYGPLVGLRSKTSLYSYAAVAASSVPHFEDRELFVPIMGQRCAIHL
jgi:hypothetical protein